MKIHSIPLKKMSSDLDHVTKGCRCGFYQNVNFCPCDEENNILQSEIESQLDRGLKMNNTYENVEVNTGKLLTSCYKYLRLCYNNICCNCSLL